MPEIRLTTPLARRLGLEVPIFQAPMASVTTPALAGAVSKAGGLGAFGCAYMQPEAMRREVAALRAVTDRPFQLNFFASPQPEPVATEAQGDAIAALAGYYRELGLPAPEPAAAPYAPDLHAQLGTAFIPCPESGATQAYRAALLAATEDDTSLTENFSGKPARGLRNRYMRETAARPFPRLPFPAQSQLTAKLRTASVQAGSLDFMAMWAGQAVALSRRLPAGNLVRELEREALEAIDRVAKLRSI